MTVGSNIFFDPSSSELAVADSVLAVSVSGSSGGKGDGKLNLVSLRMVDPPSRLTAAGVPNGANSTEGGFSAQQALELRERDAGATVWRPPRGGVGRSVVKEVVEFVTRKGGVGEEVLKGLEAVEI
jgi:exosome complex component RRP42